MSRTKIEWCTDVINCITGCYNNCSYCYARRFAQRLRGRFGYPEDEPFRPTFHEDKLWEIHDLKSSGKRIFLDSMGDWFGEGVDSAWIEQIIEAVASKPDHTFLVLTKRPDRIPHRYFPSNFWLGVSVTTQNDIWRIDALWNKTSLSQKKFISFEPLHGPIEADLNGISWVIIGAETGNGKDKIIPNPKWIIDLICDAQAIEIPIFCKNNLDWPFWFSPRLQEFPKEMKG